MKFEFKNVVKSSSSAYGSIIAGNVSIPIAVISPNKPSETMMFLNSTLRIRPTSMGSSSIALPKISGCGDKSIVTLAPSKALDNASSTNALRPSSCSALSKKIYKILEPKKRSKSSLPRTTLRPIILFNMVGPNDDNSAILLTCKLLIEISKLAISIAFKPSASIIVGSKSKKSLGATIND